MLKTRSAFIDNNLNLKFYPNLINKATSHNNALSFIITTNSYNEVCIPKDMTTGAYEVISADT